MEPLSTDSKKYPFERDFGHIRSIDKKNIHYQVLLSRLRINPNIVSYYERDLLRFTLQIISPITWYDKRLKKERLYRWSWMILSMILALVIPSVVAAIEFNFPDNSFGIAFGAAILSGFVGVHRMMNNYIEHRNIAGIFSQAASDLKELVYTLESKWAGTLSSANIGILGLEFIDDIDKAVTIARKTIGEEKLNYYGASSPRSATLMYSPPQATAQPSELLPDTIQTIGENFIFDNASISPQEKAQLLTAHRIAYFKIASCNSLQSDEKSRLFHTYTLPIRHYKLIGGTDFGLADAASKEIYVNLDALNNEAWNELPQTLIHEMMHCAGFTHPSKSDLEKYYDSPPLQAELCIAGLQSDSAEAESVRSLQTECVNENGKFKIIRESEPTD